MVIGTFVPLNFKDCCIIYSRKMFKLKEKMPPKYSEVLVHLKNIESPDQMALISFNFFYFHLKT